MGHVLLAVLVPGTAAAGTVDAELDRVIQPPMRFGTPRIDDYRFGGGVGAWTRTATSPTATRP
ncbi:hypothetical protein GA0074692_0867 [Micromonospora pallida]|uniref:Uncharacterized protein n=1 Tax=Micromonospora pallida TaxID=145854 RepID=A0A1C6RT86_9ACTN|nr:hypothetical protein [Micromonospora pallida]SCL20438.1 hypothetical protein GA0074692_0867 [Micromonospora pallida]